MSPRRKYAVALIVAVSASLVSAQDHPSHAASSTAAPRGSGFSATSRQTTTGNSSPARGHHRTGVRPTAVYGGYGYGYGWGTPYSLPNDSEYDQPAPEAQDNRIGPTIFEHNGRPSTSTIAETRTAINSGMKTETASAPATATVLVFRDGHQQEVANYAIVGDKVIVLGEKAEKIPMTNLDLDATAKANQDRGIDFKLPKKG